MRVYELSADNRIIGVSTNWDGFAAANGGAAAMAHVVMGRSIWDFVVGVDTRSYMNALFFAVRRTERRLAVSYRCDSLTERCLFQLQIDPVGQGGLRLVHVPVEVAARVKPAVRPQGEVSCCGQCLRWRHGSTWEESEHFHALSLRQVDFVVCPQCRTQAQRAIDAVMRRRIDRVARVESSIHGAFPC